MIIHRFIWMAQNNITYVSNETFQFSGCLRFDSLFDIRFSQESEFLASLHTRSSDRFSSHLVIATRLLPLKRRCLEEVISLLG